MRFTIQDFNRGRRYQPRGQSLCHGIAIVVEHLELNSLKQLKKPGNNNPDQPNDELKGCYTIALLKIRVPQKPSL